MANSWIQHVKSFADKKKMKYTDAMKSQECRSEYEKQKPKKGDNVDMMVVKKMPKKMMTEVTIETPVKLEAPKAPRRTKKTKEVIKE